MNSPQHLTDDTLQAWMKCALAKAIEGVAEGESPFGAGIFHLESGPLEVEYNRVTSSHHPSAHAEVMAINAAASRLKTTTLKSYWLVSTGEPCPMCLATAAMAGITQIVYGASASTIRQAGFTTLGLTAAELARQLNLDLTIRGRILERECSALLLKNPKVNGG
jgi:tRNA(Arg) A34 adenosine deaminase TadA